VIAASRGGPRLLAIDPHVTRNDWALATFDEPWSPPIVARYNGNKIFLAKAKGEFVWHSHSDTDDLFLVLEGRLRIELRDGDVELGPANSSSSRAAPSTARGRSAAPRYC
jgi:mannose-6-phosphate isomerase-like protein (cupin superfamily)